MRFLVLFSCIALLTPLLSWAVNFTASPLALNLDVAKRDIISETITLTNNTSRQLRIYASVNEVATDGDGTLESFVQPSMSDRTNSPTSWFSITRGRIELAPGEQRDIPFTITMNPQTKAGNYSVFVGFAEGSNEPQAKQKVLSGNGYGTLINLRVDQTQQHFLRLARYNVERFISGEKGVHVDYVLQNPGEIDVVPRGEIILYDLNGNEINAYDLNESQIAVAAGAREAFSQVFPQPDKIGKYKAFITIEYGSAVASSLTDTAFFYVFPLWQLLILFMAFLLIVLLMTFILHRRMSGAVVDHEQVQMYIKTDRSPDVHHDLNLKQHSQTDRNDIDNETSL